MIVHSPESPMPEPFKSFVRERAENIAVTLGAIVGDADVQLCPRAILPEEQFFPKDSGALIYGCVVPSHESGYKSVLYEGADPEAAYGIVANTAWRAEAYASMLLQRGDRVRIKDPEGTNCVGQSIAATMPEVDAILREEGVSPGAVLMPHLCKISDRFSAGRIRLGQRGVYTYVGREYITGTDGGTEQYAGVDLVVTRSGDNTALKQAAQKLDIPPKILQLSRDSLRRFSKRVIYDGRASIDLLTGTTDTGRPVETAVDVTPRVGNNTPAEIEGIAALSDDPAAAFACASVRLHFDPEKKKIPVATRYVDNPRLVVAAKVTEVG